MRITVPTARPAIWSQLLASRRQVGRGKAGAAQASDHLGPFGEATRQALLAYVAKRGNIPGQGALFVTCYGDAMNRHEAHRILRQAGLTGVRCSPGDRLLGTVRGAGHGYRR